jgi:hypothetical protein
MQHPSVSNMLIKVSDMARRVQKLLMEKCDLSQLTDTMSHVDLKKNQRSRKDLLLHQAQEISEACRKEKSSNESLVVRSQ